MGRDQTGRSGWGEPVAPPENLDRCSWGGGLHDLHKCSWQAMVFMTHQLARCRSHGKYVFKTLMSYFEGHLDRGLCIAWCPLDPSRCLIVKHKTIQESRGSTNKPNSEIWHLVDERRLKE